MQTKRTVLTRTRIKHWLLKQNRPNRKKNRNNSWIGRTVEANEAEMQYRFGGRIRRPADGHGSPAKPCSTAAGSIAGSVTATMFIVVVILLYHQRRVFLIFQKAIVFGGRLWRFEQFFRFLRNTRVSDQDSRSFARRWLWEGREIMIEG